MICVPNHIVSYHGQFYAAGQRFPIDPKDEEEMKQFGTIEKFGPEDNKAPVQLNEQPADAGNDMLADQAARSRVGRNRRV